MTTRRIGSTTVTRIEERAGPGFAPEMLLPDWDPAVLQEHADWIAPNYYDIASGKMMSSIHSWVIRTKHHTIVVDTCVGNHKPRPAFERFNMLDTPYLDRLKAAGVAPEELDAVAVTVGPGLSLCLRVRGSARLLWWLAAGSAWLGSAPLSPLLGIPLPLPCRWEFSRLASWRRRTACPWWQCTIWRRMRWWRASGPPSLIWKRRRLRRRARGRQRPGLRMMPLRRRRR